MPTKKVVTKTKRGSKTSKKIENFDNDFELSEIKSKKSALQTKPINKKRFILLAALIIVLGLALFYSYKFLVIAWVDQTPINRLSYYQQLDAKFGTTLKDQLIQDQLIENEAKKRGLTTSDQEVSAEIKKLEDQQGGAANLDQFLKTRSISREELKYQIKLYRIYVPKMFSDKANVSDEDVNKYIEQNKEQFKDVTDQIKQQIKEELRYQKIGEAFNTWLNEAKNSKRVVKLN